MPTLLTNFSAAIAADVVEDDGSGEIRRVFEVAVQLAGATVRCSVAATHFAGMQWPVEHLGPTALVMPGVALKDHARAAIQMLSGQVPSRRIYTHLGWRKIANDWVYSTRGEPWARRAPSRH